MDLTDHQPDTRVRPPHGTHHPPRKLTAITTPGPTGDPTTSSLIGPTATGSTAADPTVCPAEFQAPAHTYLVGPSAKVTPPWYAQKRYAFPVIALALFVILVAVVGSRDTAAAAATPATVTTPVPVVEPAPAPRPAPVAPLITDDELAGMYYKGTFLLGSQIQPGTYSTQGPTTQDDGQWARLSNTTGAPTAVIAHGIVNGPTTVTVLPTDAAFQTVGDVVWVKVQIPTPTPAPAPAAEPAPASGCDLNYSGCVPNASDVDCEGGQGNGPAYVRGPVVVTGSDIYGLDADDDGVGCES